MSDLGGRPWRRVRAQVFAEWGDICHLCGHDGAGEVDHILARAYGGARLDPANCRPAHGTRSRCYLCPPGTGKACNQAKGARVPSPRRSVSNASRPW